MALMYVSKELYEMTSCQVSGLKTILMMSFGIVLRLAILSVTRLRYSGLLTLHYIGKKVFTVIRQPSQGPTFGIKGGAAGGGYAHVVPMEDFNLHLTGDIHAVGAAHNLLAAAIDNRMAKEARWSTNFLAKALCPDDEYTPSMCRRLEKLGIESAKPSDLSDDDKERMFRLNIDPDAV